MAYAVEMHRQCNRTCVAMDPGQLSVALARLERTVSSTAEREGPTSQSGLSIVLPTFNEGGSIRQVIASLLRLGTEHPLEILVVDDDSRDGTPDLVRSLARQDNRIRIIQRVGRSGLASAIKD